ncbi:MAG TPA: hypothetical protein VGU71_21355 [Candidatus Dormibacteraeota bacterium]|nr:hypothetical protein [Candidatus Dormibacteraeota bacterium]
MDEQLQRDPRVLWSFWVACGLAVTGGIAPLLLALGGPNRLAGAVIPYAVAAGAMAANAIMYQRGRSLATALYFLAGVAIVYGMLLMFAVPLRLSVGGTCPDPPALCPAGLERGFTSGEATGFTVAVVMGVLSILSGFFGLLMLYRRQPKLPVSRPMERRIAPVAAAPATPVETPPAEPVATPAGEPPEVPPKAPTSAPPA